MPDAAGPSMAMIIAENSAPSCAISGRKVGKEVAIMVSSSTVTGFCEASPMTRKLMARRWSRWVSTSPPPGTSPAPPSTIRSSPSIVALTPLAMRPAAVAASRSDSLTRNSCKPFIRVTPRAKDGDHGEDQIFVDHRRRAGGGNIDPDQFARRERAGPRPPRRLPRAGRECRSARPFRATWSENRCAGDSSSPLRRRYPSP